MAKRPNRSAIADRLQSRRSVFTGTSLDAPRIIEVDLEKLRPNPDQPRQKFNDESLKELATSIKQHGLIQPIAVAQDPDDKDRFIVVAGERRFRAFQILNRETIPAIKTTGAPDEIALIENIQRENLHPLEEASALAKLMEKHGHTQETVAKIIGKSQATVSELIRLTTLPQAIQVEYRTSDIPKSTVIEITRMASEEEQLAAWEIAKQDGMTVRVARRRKKATSQRRPKMQSFKSTKSILDVGKGFIDQLKAITDSEEMLDKETITQLLQQGDKIRALLGEIANQNQSKNNRDT